ncbi:MAG TPA: hypothetical protein VK447_11075 [Myxococcaceae bacterium]|nr:hypothetical protein [Myxococcaceae bacterium]
MRAGDRRARGLFVLALLWGAVASAQGGAPPPSPPLAAAPLVVDQVVALVDGSLVTRLDVELEAAIVLVRRGGGRALPEVVDERLLGRVLDLVIHQRLITRDADRLQVFPVEEKDLEARLQAFEARFEGRQAFERFLARFELTRAMLGEVFRREIRMERILDNKVRLRAQVSEEELRRYYEAHAAELGPSFEAVRVKLRQTLTSERYTGLVADEVAQLRKKADVRLVAPFALRAAQEAP